MGFRTTKLGERVSVDTRKMSNGESELFEFDEDTKPYFVDYTLTDFIVKMINIVNDLKKSMTLVCLAFLHMVKVYMKQQKH